MRAGLARAIGAVMLAAVMATQAMAQTAAGDMRALIGALRVDDTVRVMRQEGLQYGDEIAQEMLPGVSAPGWRRVLSEIYDTDRMAQLVTDRFAAELEGTDIAPLVAFFTSERGREIISLELSAREAFLDDATEDAATEVWQEAQQARPRLLVQVEEIIGDSDLVEFNVMGALNANLMFYRGLADGGAIEMGEDEMLADVWSQEGDVRAQSESWLGAFLMMAYRPLDPADLDAYAALYRSEAGRALNSAIFSAYDQMYEELSYLLGQAIARQMQSEEL